MHSRARFGSSKDEELAEKVPYTARYFALGYTGNQMAPFDVYTASRTFRQTAPDATVGVTAESAANDAQREAFVREAMIHVDHLYRIAHHLAREADAVQDLVQDTFVRAIESYRLFDPPTNMRAWLTKILQNIFFDEWRKKQRAGTHESDGRHADALWDPQQQKQWSPEGQLLRKELSDHIHNSLKQIPEEFRLPIVLVDMSEFSYAEAAEVLSCPIGTIRSRLSRGRQLLQDLLGRYFETGDGSENDDLRRSPRAH
ncbi:MAG: sigma-70 family RNA polymerase sigma factor, partial [Deltaproteobacteria bacterium]|nr:sigma-70 family RNA polymerase sigma factor [Deltaproteobacteria bacterium]